MQIDTVNPEEHGVAIMARVREEATAQKRCAKEWLVRDEFGSWEKRARELSRITSAKRVELGLSDLDWTQALAQRILYEATEALYERAKKAQGK